MQKTNVLIIGLGPVGLFLTYLLGKQGVSVIGVDKREKLFQESRSIGIHPPLLDILEDNDLLTNFLQRGVLVNETKILYKKELLVSVSLSEIESRNRYVLCIPQSHSEQALLEGIKSLETVELLRGKELNGLEQTNNCVIASFGEEKISAEFVVGADGVNSTVRNLIGTEWKGSYYNDFYVMADFEKGACSSDVYIYLDQSGLLESFPLSDCRRRWVARIGSQPSQISEHTFITLINQRKSPSFELGSVVSPTRTFRASNFSSKRYFKGRVVLVGDAAHVVSPIGGQGMNLGWLGAEDVAKRIKMVIREHKDFHVEFKEYEKRQRNIYEVTMRRAAFNMSFGRRSILLNVKIKLLKLMLTSKIKRSFIQRFVMEKLIKN